MAKKELTFEDATKAVDAAKAVRKDARTVLDKFMADNGLKAKKDHSDDKKHGKEFKKLRQVWLDAKESQEKAEEAAKALKPQTARKVKYEYPDDVVTSEDKKKYRATARAKAAKEAKGESTDAKPAKKKDKAAKEEPAKKEKSKKAEPEAEAPVKKKKKKVAKED